MALRGELKYRDGLTKEIIIKTENNLPSLIAGIKKLDADVSGLLTELVVQEKLSRDHDDKGDFEADDDGDEDSDEEEEHPKAKTKAGAKTKAKAVAEPPAKRSKTLRA